MNYSDAERIGTVLNGMGYERTFLEKEADLFIVVSCSVRQSAINRIYGKAKDLNKLKSSNKKFKTVLTGCVLEKDKKKLAKIFDVMLEIGDIAKLPNLLAQQGNSGEDFKGSYFGITPKYESAFRAYVPIMTGCDNYCTYCAVPYTRGREKSRPQDEVIKEIKGLVKNGYKEITLLGQNVNSYHSSGDMHQAFGFVELLRQIDKIPGDYRVYFYSNHPKDVSDELISTLPGLKHFPQYIHLPLQSGSDKIIKKMNRHYTQAGYLALVKKIRSVMPAVALTTDVMVGFPSETASEFEETAWVMKEAEFDMAFTAQYSPREGTVSAKWTDDVSKEEKIEREKELIAILEKTALKNNQKLVGQNVRVLFDGQKGEKLYGRTAGYKVVEIPRVPKTDREKLIGQFGEVKIELAEPWKLIGSF